ncbi:MAG: autotransporter assembly complex family protein [Methylococcales bacterium]
MRRFSKVSKTTVSLLAMLWFAPVVTADVVLQGLQGDAKANVELLLALHKETCSSPQWKIKRLFNKADHDITQALRAFGYYHALIKKNLQFNDNCWIADFSVTPGPQVLVKEVSVQITGAGQDDTELLKLVQKAQQLSGAPLHHGQYEKLKSRMESLAMSRGYLRGEFTTNKLLVNTQNNTATIDLVFAAKQRLVFGDITIEQKTLKPDFVAKFIPIKPGDFYSTEQLAKTYAALSQSGYFAGIDIQPDTETQQNKVPIAIKLQAKKKHHYELGVGFDTDIGPLLSGVYSNRRINDRGHFVSSELNLSPVLSTAEVTYNIPLTDALNDFFSIGGGLKREHTDSYKSMSATLSTRVNHALRSGWKQTLFVDYSYEDFATESTSAQTLLLVPGGSWQRSVADNAVRPSNAYRAKIDISGSYRNPLSNVSFLQAAFSGVWIKALPFDGKFIGRSELGAMWVDSFADLPTTYRFYAGGINSVRGYDYKELGPKDSRDHVLGGQFLGVLSAEYEQAILDNWAIAGFIDTGNAFNIDKISFKTGVGLGVRWYSPFGPIRVDFALPLNDADSSFQIHFAAGTRL